MLLASISGGVSDYRYQKKAFGTRGLRGQKLLGFFYVGACISVLKCLKRGVESSFEVRPIVFGPLLRIECTANTSISMIMYYILVS